MRTVLLTGFILATLPVTAEQLSTPRYNAELSQPIYEYLNEGITLQTAATLNEGILAYAYQVTQGSKVTVVSSSLGLAIYVLEDNQYRLAREIRKPELGLNNNDTIGFIKVSETDAWLIYGVNGKAVSIALDAQYQPLLSSRSTTEVGSLNLTSLNNNVAVFAGGTTLKTFIISSSDGSLSGLSTVQLNKAPSNIAIANGTLAVTFDYFNDPQENLKLYRQTPDNQWQYVNGHTMNITGGNHVVKFLTVSPNGRHLVYGNNTQVYGLTFTPETTQLDQSQTGVLPEGEYSAISFVDDSNFIASNYDKLSLINSQSLQKTASLSFPLLENRLRDLASGVSTIALLSEGGIRQLSKTDLTQLTHLKPGEQDLVFNLSIPPHLAKLNDDYLLQRSPRSWNLFRLDDTKLPKLTQSATSQQLLGHESNENAFTSLSLGNNMFAILQGGRYSVLKLDNAAGQLQLLKHGTLSFPGEQPSFISEKNIANIGTNILIAADNRLNLFQLAPDNSLPFVDEVVNGTSGVTGIAAVQMVFIADDHIYTADQRNQSISHFVIQNNRLQQQNQYNTYSFPTLLGYSLHGDIITLRSNTYLQILRQATDGSLTLMTNQFMHINVTEWSLFGKRFVASRNFQDLHILELDTNSGAWLPALSMDSASIRQEFDVTASQFVSIDDDLAIYDSANKRLVRLSHNSAPTVSTQSKLQLSLHQGKTYQLALSDVFTDDEADTMVFGLQNAANNFALTDAGVLAFDGQLASAGSLDVTATDTAGLASIATVNYQINLAPVAKTAVPVITVAQGDALQFELAPYYTDPEGQALQFTLTSAQGGVNLSAAGLITGRLNTAGTVDLSFNISDSAGAISSHSVQVNVTAKASTGTGTDTGATKSSGGSLHWLLLSLLAALALPRILRKH